MRTIESNEILTVFEIEGLRFITSARWGDALVQRFNHERVSTITRLYGEACDLEAILGDLSFLGELTASQCFVNKTIRSIVRRWANQGKFFLVVPFWICKSEIEVDNCSINLINASAIFYGTIHNVEVGVSMFERNATLATRSELLVLDEALSRDNLGLSQE